MFIILAQRLAASVTALMSSSMTVVKFWRTTVVNKSANSSQLLVIPVNGAGGFVYIKLEEQGIWIASQHLD
jgi:hypothetical protein